MDTWESLFSNHAFISDMGSYSSMELSGEQILVGQYAVWLPTEDGTKHQIAEVSSDIELLKNKYDIADEYVCTVVRSGTNGY